ncbi:DUF456 domain-containing protein [Flavicella sediminum]|uniref:DUF456 domain-containing protein n=1 Tax=Flavicella sediminum TaxID=2585141 RepID=UPI0011221DE3|nr:DUF456 domain-containing protein [Flavicella sediminum]
MDIILAILGFLFISLGIIGSFLPVLPGPPTGWVGLLLLHLTDAIPTNWNFLWTTLFIAILVTVLDYIIPILSTKKFGGTKKGVWGATLGLIVGLFFGPIGIIAGPFLGAFLGEYLGNPKQTKHAFKVAVGSFIGFLFSTGLKLIVGIVFCYYFFADLWAFKADFFS